MTFGSWAQTGPWACRHRAGTAPAPLFPRASVPGRVQPLSSLRTMGFRVQFSSSRLQGRDQAEAHLSPPCTEGFCFMEVPAAPCPPGSRLAPPPRPPSRLFPCRQVPPLLTSQRLGAQAQSIAGSRGNLPVPLASLTDVSAAAGRSWIHPCVHCTKANVRVTQLSQTWQFSFL